jgi:hypothetical protein
MYSIHDHQEEYREHLLGFGMEELVEEKSLALYFLLTFFSRVMK